MSHWSAKLTPTGAYDDLGRRTMTLLIDCGHYDRLALVCSDARTLQEVALAVQRMTLEDCSKCRDIAAGHEAVDD